MTLWFCEPHNPGRRKVSQVGGVSEHPPPPKVRVPRLCGMPENSSELSSRSQTLPLVAQLLNYMFQISVSLVQMPRFGRGGRAINFYNRGIQIIFLLEKLSCSQGHFPESQLSELGVSRGGWWAVPASHSPTLQWSEPDAFPAVSPSSA